MNGTHHHNKTSSDTEASSSATPHLYHISNSTNHSNMTNVSNEFFIYPTFTYMDSICVPADPEYQMPVLHAMGWNMYMQYLEDLYDVRYIIIYVILISFGTGLFLTMIMRFVGHIFVWGLITTLHREKSWWVFRSQNPI